MNDRFSSLMEEIAEGEEDLRCFKSIRQDRFTYARRITPWTNGLNGLLPNSISWSLVGHPLDGFNMAQERVERQAHRILHLPSLELPSSILFPSSTTQDYVAALEKREEIVREKRRPQEKYKEEEEEEEAIYMYIYIQKERERETGRQGTKRFPFRAIASSSILCERIYIYIYKLMCVKRSLCMCNSCV